MARTFSEIVQDMISFITTQIPGVSTLSGTVVRNAVIDAPANEMSLIYEEIDNTKKLRSLRYADEISVEDLNSIGANYSLTRLPGSFSSGIITFRVLNFTTSESDIVIPSGTLVQTESTIDLSAIIFQTTTTVTLLSASAGSYFNTDTGFYEISVPIQCLSEGMIGNVAPGSISILTTPIERIYSVFNSYSTVGGNDIETNTDFANRILERLRGNNVGTKAGLKSLAQNFSTAVVDVSVVGPNDVEMIRNEYGGSVDVYILGDTLSTITETRVYTGTISDFILFNQPIVDVLSVSGTYLGGSYVFDRDVDYSVVIDSNSLLWGSVEAESKVVWLGVKVPDIGTSFQIEYTYNKLISDLQNEYNLDEKNILGSDILVRKAVEKLVNISAQITLLSGFNSSDVITNCVAAVSTFVNSLRLGQRLNQSDIIGTIESVSGVDSVNISTLVPTSDISAQKLEYIRINTIVITV